MQAWEAIQSSIDYIEENLSAQLDIDTLAAEAALSPYYYQRLFKQLVDITVGEYVKRRRLACAASCLLQTDQRIIAIALSNGFTDQANFSRAFKAAYGLTPNEYRKQPKWLNQQLKPDLALNNTPVDLNVPFTSGGVTIEINRRWLMADRCFIGITGDAEEDEVAGGNRTGVSALSRLWEQFHLLKPVLANLKPDGNELGVVLNSSNGVGRFSYLAAAEVTNLNIPEGYQSFQLHAGEYYICRVTAGSFNELIESALDKAFFRFNNWLKQRGITVKGDWAELYEGTEQKNGYLEIWVPVSKMPPHEWDKTSALKPALDLIMSYVDSPFFSDLCAHLDTVYHCKPILEYSRCSLQKGWNIKYRKNGRSLCTIYPLAKTFLVLIVISENEKTAMDLAMPLFSLTLQELYQKTESSMGQKWLMISVKDAQSLADVKQCLKIRFGKRVLRLN